MNRLDPTKVHIRHNPHPHQRYEITFTIHDAPGPFDSVTSEVSYLVSNEECLPTQPISGGKPGPALNLPIELTNTSPGVYTGYVYLDLPIDENYFGLGVCHWISNGVYLSMKAHGVDFGAGITVKNIEAQGAVSTYFWKEHYFEAPVEAFSDSGATYAVYSSSPDRSKYFSVVAAAKKVTP